MASGYLTAEEICTMFKDKMDDIKDMMKNMLLHTHTTIIKKLDDLEKRVEKLEKNSPQKKSHGDIYEKIVSNTGCYCIPSKRFIMNSPSNLKKYKQRTISIKTDPKTGDIQKKVFFNTEDEFEEFMNTNKKFEYIT